MGTDACTRGKKQVPDIRNLYSIVRRGLHSKVWIRVTGTTEIWSVHEINDFILTALVTDLFRRSAQ